jgi:hypothetical protein
MTNYRNEETRLGALEGRLAAIEARLDALAAGPRPMTLHDHGLRLFRECLIPEPQEAPGRPTAERGAE